MLRPEVLLRPDGDHPVALPLASEGALRYVWESRYGTILIEVSGTDVFVNGQRVEPHIPRPAWLPIALGFSLAISRQTSALRSCGAADPRGHGHRAASNVLAEECQAACSCDPRAGAWGGARASRPRCVRIFSMTGCSRIAAMIFNSPPQFGQCAMSGWWTVRRQQLWWSLRRCVALRCLQAAWASPCLSSVARGTTRTPSLTVPKTVKTRPLNILKRDARTLSDACPRAKVA